MYDIFPRYPNLIREIAFEKIIMSKAKGRRQERYFAHMSQEHIPACTFGWEKYFYIMSYRLFMNFYSMLFLRLQTFSGPKTIKRRKNRDAVADLRRRERAYAS